MGRFDFRRSSGAPTARAVTVASASGVLATLSRALGAGSTFSLAAGSSSNLSIVNGNQISATAALAAGASQTAIVREAVSGEKRAVEYPVVFSRPASVGVTLSGTLPDMIIGQAYNAQITVNPPGSAITLDAGTLAFLAAHSIAHNGTGLLTSASVT